VFYRNRYPGFAADDFIHRLTTAILTPLTGKDIANTDRLLQM